MGIETIAAALGEARDAIEEIVEPYLMQQGFVQRTPRGRVLTGAAYGHLGLASRRKPRRRPGFSPARMTIDGASAGDRKAPSAGPYAQGFSRPCRHVDR